MRARPRFSGSRPGRQERCEMYLHIGGDYIIKSKYIVGILDLDNCT